MVGKADNIRILGGAGGGTLLRERLATFEPGTGNLLEITKRLATAGVGGTDATTTITYDQFGNLATLTGPANHAGQRYGFSYTYEGVANTHVASVTDSFGYTSTAEYDLKWSETERSTDINGQVITTTFDSVGRPVTVTGPYEQASGPFTIAMDYHPGDVGAVQPGFRPWARTRHIDTYRDINDTIDTITFIDGLKRVTQTKKDLALHTGDDTSADVMVVSGRSVYDGFARVVEQFYPVTEPLGTADTFNQTFDAIQPTTTAFDILDRKTNVTNPAGQATAFVYDFGPDRAGATQFRTAVTDANGIPREVFRDVDDDIVSVKLINQGGSQVLWTSYAYDPLDQIIAVTDAKNNVTNAEYDNFGRRTAIDSPDAGRTEYIFDLASNLHRKETANLRAANALITYNYDFNRIASRVYPLFPENNVAYTYGDPGADFNRANRAFRITAESGVQEMKFGPLGEMVEQVRTVATDAGPDPVYTTTWTYDTPSALMRRAGWEPGAEPHLPRQRDPDV